MPKELFWFCDSLLAGIDDVVKGWASKRMCNGWRIKHMLLLADVAAVVESKQRRRCLVESGIEREEI